MSAAYASRRVDRPQVDAGARRWSGSRARTRTTASWVIIPTLTPEEVEDRAHPLRVAPGEVVVDGHDVDAAAGQRVEDRRPAARPGSCPRRSASRRSCPGGGRRAPISWTSKWRIPSVRFIASRVIAKTSGSDVVERLLEPLVLARPALLLQLATALEVRVVELVLGRLVGDGRLEDVRAQLRERGADLVVGECLVSRPRGRWSRRPAVGSVGSRGRSSRRNGSGSAWRGQV